tara:strand:+ start:1522 stop:2028 length:507 start_codon:yes stop_codon:yes gene_type:complete
MKNIFFTLTGYQITWLCCVFGEYYNFSFLGLIAGTLYLCIFFYFIDVKIRALKICLIFSVIGYFFDSFLGYIELFNIKSNIMFGYLPIWFLVLWPSFTTLFVQVLCFLKNHQILSLILGSSLAPPTYYLGIPLGIAVSENILLSMTIMVIFWGLYLMFYSIYIKKITI